MAALIGTNVGMQLIQTKWGKGVEKCGVGYRANNVADKTCFPRYVSDRWNDLGVLAGEVTALVIGSSDLRAGK